MSIYFAGGEDLENSKSNMFIMELNPLIKVCFSDLCNCAVTPNCLLELQGYIVLC